MRNAAKEKSQVHHKIRMRGTIDSTILACTRQGCPGSVAWTTHREPRELAFTRVSFSTPEDRSRLIPRRQLPRKPVHHASIVRVGLRACATPVVTTRLRRVHTSLPICQIKIYPTRHWDPERMVYARRNNPLQHCIRQIRIGMCDVRKELSQVVYRSSFLD